ncbi:MAG: c-type cytochrome domain-containing protein, partial [Rubripirellula sp.]
MSILPRITLFLFTTFVILTADLRSESPLNSLKSYLQEYCYSCHGPDEQQGEQRFDHLSNDLTDPLTMEAWQGILDQIN